MTKAYLFRAADLKNYMIRFFTQLGQLPHIFTINLNGNISF